MNQVEAPVFTKRTRDLLSEAEYEVYALAGRSMRRLRIEGMVYWSTWHARIPGMIEVILIVLKFAIIYHSLKMVPVKKYLLLRY